MPRQWVCTTVEHLQPFEWCCNVSLQEAGWPYQRIAAHVGHNVSVVCGCFQQWSVEHPTPIGHVLHDCVVQMHIKIDALCEQWWLLEQHPGKKSRHMLHLLCNEDHWEPSLFNRTQISCASGQATTYTTTLPSMATPVLLVMDVHVYNVDLVSIIFWSAFALMVWGSSLTTRGYIWCFCRVK